VFVSFGHDLVGRLVNRVGRRHADRRGRGTGVPPPRDRLPPARRRSTVRAGV